MQIQPYTSTLNSYKNNHRRLQVRNYSTPMMNDTVSFGNLMIMEKVTDGLAHGMGKLGGTTPVQKLVDFLKDKNYQRHIAAFVGVVLSSFYMLDTARSKKIEKEQKMPLITNQAVVCGLSTLGAYTLDNYLDKKMENIITKFNIANISDAKTQKMFAKLYDDPKYLEVVKRASRTNHDLAKNFDILDKMFEFNPAIEKDLKGMIKKGTADEHVVSIVEQLKNFLQKGDVVIGISGSGNSKNVVKAIEYANNNEGVSVGLTGYTGGKLKEIAEYSVNANINDMQISEDIHMILCHMIMQIVCKNYD